MPKWLHMALHLQKKFTFTDRRGRTGREDGGGPEAWARRRAGKDGEGRKNAPGQGPARGLLRVRFGRRRAAALKSGKRRRERPPAGAAAQGQRRMVSTASATEATGTSVSPSSLGTRARFGSSTRV